MTCANKNLDVAIHSVWKGIKTYNIDNYEIPFVHRPFSEIPGDAVSEGIGYGMLVALYVNDQIYFDKIWNAAEKYMWNGQWYDWRVDVGGSRIAYGAATDAEQDIAFALLQASKLVEDGLWKPNTTGYSYRDRGLEIIRNMWDYRMIDPDTYDIAPGAGWGGKDFVNIGYFAPAWYRTFAKYDPGHDWMRVIDRGYTVLGHSQGYSIGLAPDWMTPNDGSFITNQGLGYNAYGNGRYLYKDAIRVFWRIGMDLLWNPHEERAREFLGLAHAFIMPRYRVNATNLNFYDMQGELLPSDDVWIFNNGRSSRPRREYSSLTVGMWSIVEKALYPKKQGEFVKNLLEFHKDPTQLFWGSPEDFEINNTTVSNPKNELYFEQFLGLFGALIANDSI
jgi:hypothetical protein